jgi:hypothetical protein
MKRILLLTIVLAGMILPAKAQTATDSSLIRPDYYLYAEGLGPARFYSINGEKLLHAFRRNNRVLYARLGGAWLPDLSARYTMYALGGLNLESGEKNWSRDIGIGMTTWMDRYTWKKNGELSSHCAEKDCEPTILWGTYLSLGFRYRFDNEFFAGFEFTPMAMSSNDGPQLLLYAGISAGFQIRYSN